MWCANAGSACQSACQPTSAIHPDHTITFDGQLVPLDRYYDDVPPEYIYAMERAYSRLIPSREEVAASKQPLKQTTLDFDGNPPPPAEPACVTKPQFVVPGFWFAREFRIQHNCALAWLQHRIDKLCLRPDLDYYMQLHTDPVNEHSFYEPVLTREAANHIATKEGSERGRFVADLVLRRFGDGKRAAESPAYPSQPWDLTAMPVDPVTKADLNAITAEVYSKPIEDPDAPIQIEVLPGTQFPVDARSLHADLSLGRKFASWIQERIRKFKLVEGVDYIVHPPAPLSEGRVGRNAIEYSLTTPAASMLAACVNSEKGRKVLRYLAERSSAPIEDNGDLIIQSPGPIQFAGRLTIPRDVAMAATPDLGDADLNALFSNAHDPATRVWLRPLHAALESGQDFTDWVKRRIKDCQLIEGEHYGVCSINLWSKECGVESKGRGGHNATEYWATIEAAKEIAQMEKTERGKAVRLFLIRFQDRFRNATPPAAPVIPATIDWDDPQHLLQMVQTAGSKLLAAREANQQLLLANTALVEDVENAERVARQADEVAQHARTEKEVFVQIAKDTSAVRAQEVESILLSTWFNMTVHDHGLKSHSGFKTFILMGLMTKENIKGCRNTKESIPTVEGDKYLMMSSNKIPKTTTENVVVCDENGEPVLDADGHYQFKEKVVPVIGADGKQVFIIKRSVRVIAHKTPDLMYRILTSRTCLLRRLVRQRPGSLIQKRLAHRFSLMWFNSYGWEELDDQQWLKAVRMAEVGPDAWVVECFVQCDDKARSQHVAQGQGRTQEEALADLAFNYYTPCDKTWMGNLDTYLERSHIELHPPQYDKDDDSTDTALTHESNN